ncbi:hypothetical protein [Vibrio paucivorans]|uniref:Uncharacterized protein n=1 Tax=Vibrio paucivorans TaxID=2829489 RepID=A0A9X3CHB5_9VIBR|nr:hypothetical protein [Vibrio paucivorans]MCW8335898.1 hypothetical protein [Vibrio paucivorans]
MNNPKLTVQLKSNEHCNLDSLPLRFGFSFPRDTTIEIFQTSQAEPDRKHGNRAKFDGYFLHPTTQERCYGTFVVLKTSNGIKLVTVWRNDQDTEFYLSEVMKNLRKDGELTTEILLDLHPKYVSGQLTKHSDLVNELSQNKASVHINAMQLKTDLFVDKLRREHAESSKALHEEIQSLKQELEKEQLRAGTSQVVTKTAPDILVSVEIGKVHRGSPCTILTMKNGQQWFMKTSTFDKTGTVTRKAKALIGHPVVVTSWDPVREPGKWSKQGYFRNVFEA